jgi:general secretion pathway protein G
MFGSEFSVRGSRFAGWRSANHEPNLNTNREARSQKCERRLRDPTAGFTLIELLIVMMLIVILAGIGLAVHGNSQTRAREAVLKEDLFRLRDAIDQYYADKNAYPPALEDLVSQKYLRAIPVDPFTNSSSTWQTVMSELDPANPSAMPGVFDVKSGADGTALDGTRYADW